MNADTAIAKQIELYRRMTGEQRLGIALDMHEKWCEIAREGIRRQHPQANPEEVQRLLRCLTELEREQEYPLRPHALPPKVT